MNFRTCVAFVIATAVLVSGCTTTPKIRALTAKTPKVRELSQEEKDQLSYIARPILSAENQNKLIARVSNVGYASTGGGKDAVAIAGTLAKNGTLIGGSATNTFVGISLAIDVLSLLAGDGSREIASGFFLPKKIGDIELNTSEQATDFAFDIADQQIKTAAKRVGYEAEFFSAKKMEKYQFRGYSLRRINDSNKFEYSPQYMYVSITMPVAGMLPMKANPLDIWALGFEPSWTSGVGNSAMPFLAVILTDNEGKPVMRDGDYLILKNEPQGPLSPLGREFLRAYYDDALGYSYYANDAKKIMIYKGKSFGYSLKNSRIFIDRETSEDVLKNDL